jgi:hypothetical protein
MTSTNKNFCPHCLKSGKGSSWRCGKHLPDDYISSKKIRYPKQKSSKTRWKEFIKFLESHWIYENGKDKFAQEFRRKVIILKKTIGVK